MSIGFSNDGPVLASCIRISSRCLNLLIIGYCLGECRSVVMCVCLAIFVISLLSLRVKDGLLLRFGGSFMFD